MIPEAGVAEPDQAQADSTPLDEATTVDQFDPVKYLKKYLPQAQYYRMSFDRNWFRSILFYVGIQWIRYEGSSLQWKSISLPTWFPKQVTNKFAVACNIMKSVFMQSDPVSVYTPATSDPKDISSARAAESVSRYIEREVNQSELESEAASLLTLTGNAFIIDGYDADKKHGTTFIQDLMCLLCQKHLPFDSVETDQDGNEVCPQCNNPVIPALDGNGQPIGQEYPTGKISSKVASPFEIHCEMTAKKIEDSPYIIHTSTYPVDVLKDMFPEFKDKIRAEDTGINSGMFYQNSLAYLTNGAMGSPGSAYGSIGAVDNIPRSTLYHLYIRPTEELKNGLEAIIISDYCVWKNELSYRDEAGKPFIPIVHMQFDRVPGRVFGKTPADDVVWKQIQLNKTEAFIQLSLEKMANPVWLVPKGSGAKLITGQPGQNLEYNSIGGLKPERVPGMEIPGSVYRWHSTLNADIQDISHTPDVLRGMAPKGIPTLGGAQLILERGFAGFSDALKSWGAAWNESRKNRLMIWRQFAVDEKTMMVLGENKEWETKNFSSESVSGHINVYLDEGSIAPKSKAYQQLITGQLLQTGLVNMQDPSVRSKVMNIFDAGNLVEDVDIDIKDAAKEKEEFLATGVVRPRPGIDNDAIHALEHTKFAKTDEFSHLSKAQQAVWIQHDQYHQKRVAQQQQQQMMNDPKIIAAKMNMEAREGEVKNDIDALRAQKELELQSLAARQKVNLQSHAIKKGMDIATKSRLNRPLP